MKTIYLAGNITGESYEEATLWRRQVTELIGDRAVVLDPMRGKENLSSLTVIGPSDGDTEAIFHRDLEDVKSSDILLAYLSGPSIGTLFELGYAYALGKHVIVCLEGPMRRYSQHPFLKHYHPHTSLGSALKTLEVTLGYLKEPRDTHK